MQAYGVSWGDRKGRRRAAVAAATATALLVPAGGFGHAGTSGAHASVLQRVIVQALPDALATAEHAVSAAGGTVTRPLDIVNGFAATVPAGTRLGTTDGVLAMTPDRVLTLQGSDYSPIDAAPVDAAVTDAAPADAAPADASPSADAAPADVSPSTDTAPVDAAPAITAAANQAPPADAAPADASSPADGAATPDQSARALATDPSASAQPDSAAPTATDSSADPVAAVADPNGSLTSTDSPAPVAASPATLAPTQPVVPGVAPALESATGASAYWQQGMYGQGVGVALIDSGIVGADGLRRNVYYGPDLTPQVLDPALKFLDSYGHGTFMASIIAGRTDKAVRPYQDPTQFVGVAPEANLVSVKVADGLGITTESAVVAGVDWAVQHRDDNNLNIRVINLSLGVPGGSYLRDPLAAAVERAWHYGVTVVSATGNEGAPSVDLPAADPYDIAVGAVDGQGTADAGDDTVASFSNTGNAARHPDLVAPGTHIVGLRDPGSYIDLTYGGTGRVGDTLFRGSGTSEAAAVTSGAAALVIEANPGISPDQVKALLTGSAAPLSHASVLTQGAGALDLTAAFGTPLTSAQQSYRHAFDYASFANRFAGGSWDGNVWQSPTWLAGQGGSGGSLSGSRWSGSRWSGSRWSGSLWTGSRWSGSFWTGSLWTGSRWSGSFWTGHEWH